MDPSEMNLVMQLLGVASLATVAGFFYLAAAKLIYMLTNLITSKSKS